jgi:hypothetical protein
MSKLLIIFVCTIPLLAQAQIYKWVDAKGVAHYTDNKFEAGETPVKELKPNGPPSTPLPEGVTWQERDAEFRRKQQYKLLNPTYRPRQLQASHCQPNAGTICR